MKKQNPFVNLLGILLLLITFACSNDDDAVAITLQDLVVTIDENPTQGQVIGTIQSNSNQTLTYSITTQTPAGSLSINASSGELTVANASMFDFEMNTVIVATVAAIGASNTASVTININDLSTDNFPTNGLKSHYKFNDNAMDSGSNNYNATDFNISYSTDRNNNSNGVATFNGVDSYLEFPDAARFEPLTSSTVSFWIKTDQQSRFDLIDQRTGSFSGNNYNFGIVFNIVGSGGLDYNYPNYSPAGETSYSLNSISISDGMWHNLIFVKDVENGIMKLFVDNVEVSNIALVQDYDFIINGTLLIGKNYASGGYFNGDMDDLFIYDRALTDNEISALYNYSE